MPSLFASRLARFVSLPLASFSLACSEVTEGSLGPDGVALIGVASSVDACETMPVIAVSAMRAGEVLRGYTGEITLSIQSGSGVPAAVLSGARAVRAVAGVATFTDLSINAAGAGYRLVIEAAGAGTVVSPTFAVVPGGPHQLGFAASPPINSASLALPPVRVAVRDACGSVIPGSTAPVTLSFNANSSSATLLGTTTVNAVNGIASFLDLSASKAGPGFTLAASSPGLVTAQSVAFTVAAPPGR